MVQKYFCAVIAVCSCLVSVYVISESSSTIAETDVLQERLISHQVTSRQLLQQLDELGSIVFKNIQDPRELTSEERALLQTWNDCDENLLVRVQQLQILSPWEQARLSQRAGIMRGLLGDYPRAIEHLQQTAVLLNGLVRDNPEEAEYVLTAVDNLGRLACCHAQLDMNCEALNDCAQGLAMLDSNARNMISVGEYRILEAISKIKYVAFQLKDHGLSYRVGLIELYAWRSLLDGSPDDPEIGVNLNQTIEYMAELGSNKNESAAD